jgi:hypothetical protein
MKTPAYPLLHSRLRIRISGIALAVVSLGLLGAGNIATLADAMPNPAASAGSSTGYSTVFKDTQLINTRKVLLDNQTGKWIRMCKDKAECSSLEDEVRRRSTFRA